MAFTYILDPGNSGVLLETNIANIIKKKKKTFLSLDTDELF